MSEPVKPKPASSYLDIVRETTPESYHQRVLDPAVPEAAALYRALAGIHGFTARRVYEQAQAQFFRTHSTADAPPASSWRYAQGLVSVRRAADLGDARFVDAGVMVLEGPGGRSWQNAASIYWRPNDSEPEKSVLFVATSPGLVGNIDHLGDGAGLITKEREGQPLELVNNEPDLSVVFHADLSEGRTGVLATVLPPSSPDTYSRLRDNGRADQFSATNRGIYIRIDDAANAENVGRLLRVVRVVFPGIELPIGSGLYPHEIEVDDLPLLTAVAAAYQDDGGAFTDYTAEADDDTPDDVVPVPAAVSIDDAFYVGSKLPFLGLAVAVTTATATEYTLVWEYWDGALWQTYPGMVDNSQSFHVAGEVRIEAPALPGFWAVTTVNGLDAYWIRGRVFTLVGGDVSTALLAKVKTLQPNRLTVESSIQWSMLDWKDLRFDLTEIEAFSGGRDNTLGLLGEERGMTQGVGEDDEKFRERIANLADVVTPAAILRAVNRALAPYTLNGLAQDVQNGMTGLFCDAQDAFDFYQPGALFPTDPFKLLYTDALAYGGFQVILPYLSDGEFGCAFDEGPVIYLEPKQVFLGPAFDACYCDGGPALAADTYSALYQTISEIKLCFINWIMLRMLTMNVPAC